MNRKCVLVTGGAKGLGAAIVKEFAKHDCDVIFTYLKSEKEAKQLINEIKSDYDVEITSVKLDLENENEIEKFTSTIKKVDVLVNNAAYNDDKDICQKSSYDFIKTYKINTVGPFLLSTKLYKTLKKNGGNIVNVASTNGIDTMYEESADYDASKAALLNLTKNLARSFAPEVRVNAIAPGWIETPSTEDMEPRFRTQEKNRILLKRFANPSEVAAVIYFLASDDASYINGSVLRVDGGTDGY